MSKCQRRAGPTTARRPPTSRPRKADHRRVAWGDTTLQRALPALTLALAWLALAGPATAGISPDPSLSNTVGIRVSVTELRPDSLEADLDLTMYTRFPYAYSTYPAGAPTFGVPALDYGDGSTVPTTPLALATSGGGPNGSNVYRSLTSFTHTYPTADTYTVTAGMFCTLCGRSDYVLFNAGSPVPDTFTGSYDLLPTSVIGNLAARTEFGDTLQIGLGTSVRYAVTLYYAVTNTTRVDFLGPSVIEIPTLSEWGLVGLSVVMMLLGLAWLRRQRSEPEPVQEV